MADDFQNIKDLPIKLGVKLLIKRIKENKTRALWERWLALYPYMIIPLAESKGKRKPYLKYVPFEKWVKTSKRKVSTKTDKEIFEQGMTAYRLTRRKDGAI